MNLTKNKDGIELNNFLKIMIFIAYGCLALWILMGCYGIYLYFIK